MIGIIPVLALGELLLFGSNTRSELLCLPFVIAANGLAAMGWLRAKSASPLKNFFPVLGYSMLSLGFLNAASVGIPRIGEARFWVIAVGLVYAAALYSLVLLPFRRGSSFLSSPGGQEYLMLFRTGLALMIAAVAPVAFAVWVSASQRQVNPAMIVLLFVAGATLGFALPAGWALLRGSSSDAKWRIALFVLASALLLAVLEYFTGGAWGFWALSLVTIACLAMTSERVLAEIEGVADGPGK